jgi:hypothetical protein
MRGWRLMKNFLKSADLTDVLIYAVIAYGVVAFCFWVVNHNDDHNKMA